jgi:hypothetical protein
MVMMKGRSVSLAECEWLSKAESWGRDVIARYWT